ncbi:MAG: hypothetical protein JSU73_10680 [candidate division WOR-3 bacterium]|nr:MAG: hypothetical protein JSU73_10680 [candidate division WOR-3 bacterium]
MPGPGDPIPTHRKERQESSGARAHAPLALGNRLPGFALLDWTISLPAPPGWHCSLCPTPGQGNGCEPATRSLSRPTTEGPDTRSWTVGWLSDSSAAGTQMNIRSCNTRASTLTA